MGLRLTPKLTEKFASLDRNHNASIDYDEVKYHSNDSVIELLNAAVEEDKENAVAFFMSFPSVRVANLFVESYTTRPLDEEFLYAFHDAPASWAESVVEALLSSGLKTFLKFKNVSLYAVVDQLVLAASDPAGVQGYLAKIYDVDYLNGRMQHPKLSEPVDYSQSLRKAIVNDLADAELFLIARQRAVNYDMPYQDDIHVEAASSLASKVLSDDASYDNFESMKVFLDNLYLDDPRFVARLYQSGNDSVQKVVEIFLSDRQVEGVVHFLSNDKKNAMRQKRAQFHLIKVQTKAELDALSGDKSKPMFVTFGAVWCSPCQIAKRPLPYLARLFGDKINIVYTDIDQNDLADAWDVHKKHSGGLGVPDMGIYMKGKFVKKVHDMKWDGWEPIKNAIK